jgi:glycosyltransferase involved in cell wall biosynthesis
VGGIEQVSLALAREFSFAGHAVKVVTSTAGSDHISFPFEVLRNPSPQRLLKLVRWCDVFLHNNISLRTAWPLLLIRRPWVIAHHIWIARMDGSVALRDRLKLFLSRFANNIAISQSIADHLGVPSVVTGNPYRDDIFQRDPSAVRDRELIFVGRLVSDKGADILLEALQLLRSRGLRPWLTIVGSGPEADALWALAERLQLTNQVNFVGAKTGSELAGLLNRHQIIEISSRWREPFGLVALEGLACGCKAIVARCGGLVEAIGPCAIPFEHQSVAGLADAIRSTLQDVVDSGPYWQLADEVLRPFRAKEIAQRYLEVLAKKFVQLRSGK